MRPPTPAPPPGRPSSSSSRPRGTPPRPRRRRSAGASSRTSTRGCSPRPSATTCPTSSRCARPKSRRAATQRVSQPVAPRRVDAELVDAFNEQAHAIAASCAAPNTRRPYVAAHRAFASRRAGRRFCHAARDVGRGQRARLGGLRAGRSRAVRVAGHPHPGQAPRRRRRSGSRRDRDRQRARQRARRLPRRRPEAQRHPVLPERHEVRVLHAAAAVHAAEGRRRDRHDS